MESKVYNWNGDLVDVHWVTCDNCGCEFVEEVHEATCPSCGAFDQFSYPEEE